jgi:hypothetical protein
MSDEEIDGAVFDDDDDYCHTCDGEGTCPDCHGGY